MESLPQADVKKFYYRRSFSEENIARFQSALNSESWHGVFDDRDFNTQFQSFYDVLLYHFNLCFPLMKRPVRQSSSSPWYNNELRQMATELRELSTLCKNTSDKDETDHLKKELGSKFKLKDLGRIKECLGMQVHYDVEGKVITLSQKNYINLLLKKFNMLDTKTFKTPMEVKLNLDNNETSDSIRAQYPYQKLIGCLMYLSILTRPLVTPLELNIPIKS
ncbi:Reverse transcriptase (RNA-dependent DNA polymerase) [Popillia japonica]|uniref:Reverse transcriptase (RNA-dependent DNA polymerase) n=1 Tax=Popillia japonica TaxID=7064 RepID=A0AAW1HF58_POPJA